VRWWALLLVVLGAALPSRAPAQEDPGARLQVFLMTMGPGVMVYERFGHNAIWVRDTVSGADAVYNYGTFDFAQPGFLGRFVMGRPQYWLGVSDLATTLRTYDYFGRRVEVQELDLPPAMRAELAVLLAENARPEQREYRYDYYRDNCSTRVRDMLDRVLGGALRRATEEVPGEGTLRFHTQRSVSNDPAMYLGILAGMGAHADDALDQWGEMFLPAKVQERVRELRVRWPDGREVPLVRTEATLLDLNRYTVEPTRPNWTLPLAGMGVAIAGLILLARLGGAAGTIGRLTGTVWLVVSGVGGLVLLFLWFGTNHVFSRDNFNVLLLTPTGLVLIPAVWRGEATRWLRIHLLVLVTGVAAVLVGWQTSWELVALALPPGLATAWVAARRARSKI
jgi:hypothetical protein